VQADDESTRPNILIILGDNWAWPHASAAGDLVVKTPTFDRIAREGALCTHTFCQVPSCSPARAVLLTGQACHRLGDAANLWSSWPHSLITYPEILEDAGYIVGCEGKGWGPGVIYQRSNARRNRNPAGRQFASFAKFLAVRQDDQPFCYWFGSHDPHQPWNADPKFREGMDASKVKVPEYLPDTSEIREAIIDYYAEVQQLDHEAGDLLAELERQGLAENTLVVMLGDNGWQTPRGLANVYDAGTRTPMAIRFPGVVKAKRTLEHFISFEDLAPTFLEVAGIQPDRKMTGRSLLPLLRGLDVSDWPDAVFLERERHANVRANDASYPCRAIRTRDYLYVWNIEPDLWPAGDPETHFAVGPYGDVDNTNHKIFLMEHRESPEFKRFFDLGFGKRPEEELYDLKTDPDQIRNIAADADRTEVVKALRDRVQDWMHRTGDPRSKELHDERFTKSPYFGGPAKQK